MRIQMALLAGMAAAAPVLSASVLAEAEKSGMSTRSIVKLTIFGGIALISLVVWIIKKATAKPAAPPPGYQQGGQMPGPNPYQAQGPGPAPGPQRPGQARPPLPRGPRPPQPPAQ
jgi:hypothetical protein